MNWLVGLVLVLKRTSLILIGRTLRSLAVVVSDCVRRVAGSVHSALPVRKPAADVGGEVTLKVALTLAPGATGSLNVTDVLVAPETTASHPAGMEILNLTVLAGDPVVFVNVSVTSCIELSLNVVTRDRLTCCTSYLAATMFDCTASVVASAGNPVVITPS